MVLVMNSEMDSNQDVLLTTVPTKFHYIKCQKYVVKKCLLLRKINIPSIQKLKVDNTTIT